MDICLINKRIDELDYLKSIMIVLMIAFHLVYIGDGFPYAKRFVYTFHMPVFLLLSGYLMNIDKGMRKFMRQISFYAVPYVVMESGYTVMASLLPIREHIDHLSLTVFLDKLILHPLGPYWYLHTLIICGITYYLVFHLVRLRMPEKYILTGIVFFLFGAQRLLSFPSAFYFLIGIVVRQSHVSILAFFQPSWLSSLALALLVLNPANMQSGSTGSLLVVWLMTAFCLAVWPYVKGRLRSIMLLTGRNTMLLFLFSPIFTVLCKGLVPFFLFDSTRMLFLVVSLAICISGSFAIGLLMDNFKLSPYFFGRTKILV